MPAVFAVGALATGNGVVAPPFPADLFADDILIMQILTPGPNVPTLATTGGGSWFPVGLFGGGASGNAAIRGTWFWSRYNGTATAPTLNSVGVRQFARIVCVRECITTGDPYVTNQGAPNFPETTSSISSVDTPIANCLVLDCIVGPLPDVDSIGVYTGWSNAALTDALEIFNASSAFDIGGSMAMRAATMATAGTVGVTTVDHESFHAAYKKIALLPSPNTATLAVALDAVSIVAMSGVEVLADATLTLDAIVGTAVAYFAVAGSPWSIQFELEELP